MAIWSYLRQFMYTKFIIVVDDDIDIYNEQQVLGPMLARRLGWPERGVRKLGDAPGAEALKATLAEADPDAVRNALQAAVTAYLDLRSDAPPAHRVGQHEGEGLGRMLLRGCSRAFG